MTDRATTPSCSLSEEVASVLVDASASEDQDPLTRLARRHVLGCSPCRDAVRRLATLERAYRERPRPSFSLSLAELFQAEDGTPRFVQRRPRPRGIRFLGAAALLVAGVLWLAFGWRVGEPSLPARLEHDLEAPPSAVATRQEPEVTRTAYVGWTIPVRPARFETDLPELDDWLKSVARENVDREELARVSRRWNVTPRALERALLDETRAQNEHLETILRVLTVARAPELEETLERLARDPSTEALALRAAARVSSRRALALIASRYPEPGVRLAWLDALRRARSPRLLPLLATALDDGLGPQALELPSSWRAWPGVEVLRRCVSLHVHTALIVEASLAHPEEHAVEQWFALLQREDLSSHHERIAERLAKVSDVARHVNRWSRRFRGEGERAACFRLLAACSDPVTLEILRRFASTPAHRLAALRSLARRAVQPEALAVLVEQWAREPDFTTDASRVVLDSLSPSPALDIPTLERVLATASLDRRRIALVLLARSGTPRAFEVMEKHLERRLDREHVILALAHAEGARAVELLALLANDEVFGDLARLALGLQGSEEAAKVLAGLLEEATEATATAWVAWLRILKNVPEKEPDVQGRARVLSALKSYRATLDELETTALEARRSMSRWDSLGDRGEKMRPHR